MFARKKPNRDRKGATKAKSPVAYARGSERKECYRAATVRESVPLVRLRTESSTTKVMKTLNEKTVGRRKRLPHLDETHCPNVGQALSPANSDVFNGAYRLPIRRNHFLILW